jgi:hypothetical protein
MTSQQIQTAAESYALGLADQVLITGTPEFRRQVEQLIRVAFLAGANYALKSQWEEQWQSVARMNNDQR